MTEEEKTMLLYKVQIGYRPSLDVKVVSVMVIEKLKSYRVVSDKGVGPDSPTWRALIRKADIGHEFFLSAEEALRHFIAVRKNLIESHTETLHALTVLMENAEAELIDLKDSVKDEANS